MNQGSQPVVFTATQLLLYFLYHLSTPIQQGPLMDRLVQVADRLKSLGYEMERGLYFRNPYCDHHWSEPMEACLWYWFSNGFIVDEGGGYVLAEKGHNLLEAEDLKAVTNRGLTVDALSALTSTIQESIQVSV